MAEMSLEEFKQWLKEQFGECAEDLAYPPLRLEDGLDDDFVIRCKAPRKMIRRNREIAYILVQPMRGVRVFRLNLTNPNIASTILGLYIRHQNLENKVIHIKVQRVGEALRVDCWEVS